mmetsp:Transcript_3151/g.13666  ORF Transcript_3151/g.13666 Transcript_3151/m.13666 type:complete len:237 (-) Transcript_3151:1591-2301(-)
MKPTDRTNVINNNLSDTDSGASGGRSGGGPRRMKEFSSPRDELVHQPDNHREQCDHRGDDQLLRRRGRLRGQRDAGPGGRVRGPPPGRRAGRLNRRRLLCLPRLLLLLFPTLMTLHVILEGHVQLLPQAPQPRALLRGHHAVHRRRCRVLFGRGRLGTGSLRDLRLSSKRVNRGLLVNLGQQLLDGDQALVLALAPDLLGQVLHRDAHLLVEVRRRAAVEDDELLPGALGEKVLGD